MTRLEFLSAERNFVLSMIGLILLAVLVYIIGQPLVAGIMLFMTSSMLVLLVYAMFISDEGRKHLHIESK